MKATFSSPRQIDFKPIDNNETILLEHMKDIANNQLSFKKDEKYGDISLIIDEPKNIAEVDNLAGKIIHMNFPESFRDLVDTHEIMLMKDGSKIECLVLTEEVPEEPSEVVDAYPDYQKIVANDETAYNFDVLSEDHKLTIQVGNSEENLAFVADDEIRQLVFSTKVDTYIEECKKQGRKAELFAFIIDVSSAITSQPYKNIVITECYKYDYELAKSINCELGYSLFSKLDYIVTKSEVIKGYEYVDGKIIKSEGTSTEDTETKEENSCPTLTDKNDKYQSVVPEGYYVDPTAPCGFRKCRPGHIHGATYMHPDCCICNDHLESLMKRTIVIRLVSETLGEVVLYSLVGIDDVRINMKLFKVDTATDMTVLDVNKNSPFYDCFKI